MEDANIEEQILLASEDSGLIDDYGQPILHVTPLHTGQAPTAPPLAEDGLPYVSEPLECGEDQAYCLEIPIKAKEARKWIHADVIDQFAAIASAGRRARAEVHLKDLGPADRQLFEAAKQKGVGYPLQQSIRSCDLS